MGLSISDMELLDIGLVYDMMTEKINDTVEEEYAKTATQEDFDNF